MTLQEIYDAVKAHLIKQGEKSMTGNSCSYRGEDNNKCAVGCLIKDEYYSQSLEGKRASSRAVFNALRNSGVLESEYEPNKLQLLDDLQGVHDCDPIGNWIESLEAVAWRYDLKP